MADIKIKIKINDEGDNLSKLSDAINGFYPTWQTDNPDMDIDEFIEDLIMQDFLIPLVRDHEKKVIRETSATAQQNLTDVLVDHDT